MLEALEQELDANIVIVSDKDHICSMMEGKGVTSWQKGQVLSDEWITLAVTSPQHRGDKQTYFVCSSGDYQEYLLNQKIKLETKNGRDVLTSMIKGESARDSLKSLCDKLKTSEVSELETQANVWANNAIFAQGYMLARGVAGCGDDGHEEAMKKAHKYLAKVRKAMGFTVP